MCILDIATRDKLIFPLAIMRILQHFSIPIPFSPFFTIMGAICASSVRRSEALLRPKQPRVETTDLATSAIPPSSSAPSTLAHSSFPTGVALNAIMEQLQWMHADFGGCLDYLIDEMCQMNTRIGRIACRQAYIGGYGPSPFTSPEHLVVSPFEDDEDDAGSLDDDEMMTFQ